MNPLAKYGLLFAGLMLGAACGQADNPTAAHTASDAGQPADARAHVATPGPDASRVAPSGTDAGKPPEANKSDAGEPGCGQFKMPSDIDCSAPSDGVLPKDLRCTGLYSDFATRTVACGLLEYKPAYQLWSDGAEKRRWASIPAGMKIDASDADAFSFPVGTKFFKEFRIKDANGSERMAETRLLQKSDDGWIYTSYVWSEDETQAIQMDNTAGVQNLYGTGHTVPNRDQCNECHVGRKDLILGWDALMLGPGAEGVTREELVALDLVEPGSQLDLTIPGNAVEKAALGYLHANCGISCHNELTDSKGRDSGLYLRLEKNELGSVSATDAFTSGMNKAPSANAKIAGLPAITGRWYGIRPGDPARSLLVVRQQQRGVEGQMPRIATNLIDDAGVQVTTAWIASMTKAAGYPDAGTEP